jgi:hypothetical protein
VPKATTIAKAAMVATAEFLEQAMTPLGRRAGPVEPMKVTMDLSARAAREATAHVAGTAAAGCSAMMSLFPLERGVDQEMMPLRARGPVAAVVARELLPTKNLRSPVLAVAVAVVVVRGLSVVAEALVRVAVVVRLECGRLESIASSFVSRWWRQAAVALVVLVVLVALVALVAAAGKAKRASEATKKTRQVAMEPVVAVVALAETVATVAAVPVARRSEC